MNKKIVSIISIVGVLIIFLVSIIFLLYNKELTYKENITIKIGENVPTVSSYFKKEDLKRLKDKDIKWNHINIENNRIYYSGNYVGYINFRNKKIKLGLEVIDDIKPTIDGVEDITIYVNEDVDLLKNITVSDNSHGDINIKVVGEFDNTKACEYQLSYEASDESGNKETKDFKLIVKEKEVIDSSEITNNIENIDVGTTSNGYVIKKINGLYYINNTLIVNKTYSLPSSYNPNGLLNDFQIAFSKMSQDALNQGINLFIVSGFRSYYRQSVIYNNYVNKEGMLLADTYSARAGHSEHQSGLAADINSLDRSFINTKEGQWLNNNCYKYGFIIRYPDGKDSITGYMYEPWHIRYVGASLAKVLYNNGNWITLEEYFGITSNYN